MDKTVQIGDTTVNRLGFGAMRITGSGVWGEPDDRDNALNVLKKAVALDVNFIDTADAYGPEVSEKLIREALAPYDGLVIATKGGLTRSGPNEWNPDCRPEHLREAVLASLERLGVAYIDLYQLHTVDPNVPFMDSFKTMQELYDQGTIKHIGLSNVEPEHLQQAIDSGTPITSVQNNYSVLNREHEDVLDLCREHNIIFIPYFPVGGNASSMHEDTLKEIAEKHGATVHQIALAWLLQHYEKMLPIPGTANLEHLEENMQALNLQLDTSDIDLLNRLSV